MYIIFFFIALVVIAFVALIMDGNDGSTIQQDCFNTVRLEACDHATNTSAPSDENKIKEASEKIIPFETKLVKDYFETFSQNRHEQQ